MSGGRFRVRLLAGSVLAALGALLLAAQPSQAASVPYTDANAVGSIGLCDQSGQALTHGSIYTRPFVWKAVDETAAPAPYNTSSSTATLYAYQPRQGVDAPDWSGAQLDVASKFSDPAHPAAAMTGLDQSLAIFVADFPPTWNGFIQLRIYLNAPGQPTLNSPYDAANVQVNGTTWAVVGGNKVACSAGQAQSLRQVVASNTAAVASLTAQTTESAMPNKVPSGQKTSAAPGSTGLPSGSRSGSNGVVPAPSGSPGSGSSAPVTDPSASTIAATGRTGSGSHALLWILVVVGVIGVAFVGVQWVRSRS
jgi:hypothetical protein